MDHKADQMRIKQLLTATVASLCSNSLSYNVELTIQGLIGITIDQKDIMLVNINETIAHDRSSVGQHCQTVVHTQAEDTQIGTFQPASNETDQNYVQGSSAVAVRPKQAVNTGKSAASKKRVSEHIINRTDKN